MARLFRNAARQYGVMEPPTECAGSCSKSPSTLRCKNMANNKSDAAQSETRALGKSPALCDEGSTFNNAYASCSECVIATPEGSFYEVVYLQPTFQQYLDYCASLEKAQASTARMDRTAAAESPTLSPSSPSPTTSPSDNTLEPRPLSTSTPPDEGQTTPVITTTSPGGAQPTSSLTTSSPSNESSPSPLLAASSSTSPSSTSPSSTSPTSSPISSPTGTISSSKSPSPSGTTSTPPQGTFSGNGPLITIITGPSDTSPPSPPFSSSSPSSSLPTPILLAAIIAPLLFLTLILLIAFCWWKYRAKTKQSQPQPTSTAPPSIYSERAQMIDGRSLYSLPVPAGTSFRSAIIGNNSNGSMHEVDVLPVYREVMGEGLHHRFYVEMSAVRSVGELSGGGVRGTSVNGSVVRGKELEPEVEGEDEDEMRDGRVVRNSWE
ncbi:hypothetical protein QBC44DRAFT_386882 [Cladorrhinum sp. PSN332]|nr:hypothetical protein QBC44DRAFT_386882 [Cladorrhinum sp. PSN332]